ncbi:MAG: polynucleotide adenylyltransferase PcnB [Chrysiogenetes bacterium]|nr:polynucleotide adenylyltransferase PcnB [Chrysiogenetes bacterium]
MEAKHPAPLVIPRAEHPISRQKVSPDALKVLYRLYRNGYKAYLVGGSVRDLLLKREPKDFDIATDAHPREVNQLFKNSRVIGRRFKVVHVHFGKDRIVEVSTFRSQPEDVAPDANKEEEAAEAAAEEETEEEDDGPRRRRINENTFGTEQEDALRRDLTINGLFYDIGTFSIIDYVGGLRDLHQGVIRIIGDPKERLEEDPVRIIRAIRHAARTDFTIEPATAKAIRDAHQLLPTCAPARVFEEFLRELRGGYAYESFRRMCEMEVLKTLYPQLAAHLGKAPRKDPEPGSPWFLLESVDRLRAERGPVPDSILLGVILASMLRSPIDAACETEATKAEVSQRIEKLRRSADAVLTDMGIPRKIAGAVVGHLVGLSRVRRALMMQNLGPSVRGKSYFADAYATYEIDAIARGEMPVDPEHLTLVANQRANRRKSSKRGPRRRKKKAAKAQ